MGLKDDCYEAASTIRDRCAEIAESYLHAETNDSSAPDRLDHIARYSNSTVRRIAAAIRALPEAAGADTRGITDLHEPTDDERSRARSKDLMAALKKSLDLPSAPPTPEAPHA